MNQTTLCQTINNRNLVKFYYNLGSNPGYRTVEPYMIAYNKADHLCLSAWFLSGTSESREGQGWREYLLPEISSISVLEQTFSHPRVGYDPEGGKKYHKVQCSI
jgi:predicted DNA-binding transcriptional regulator YafY